MGDQEKKKALYATNVALTGTCNDLQLKFIQNIDDNITGEETIVLSWPLAKQVAALFADKVIQYEKLYSNIQLMPDEDALKEMKEAGQIK